MKRLCSTVKLTAKQKSSAKIWLQLLDSDSLNAEKSNYFKFAMYVLQDLLGYPVKQDLKFEEGNVEFSFRNTSGKKGVCIEVKGSSTKDLFTSQHRDKPEHETPIKQTWDYMGKGDFDYGISTNYKTFVLIDRSKGYSKYHVIDFCDIKDNEYKLKEFVAIFSMESVIKNSFIHKLYYESAIEEHEFTKQFYKLYHETRLMLIKEYEDNGIIQTEAIHFAQLFLNRLIFLFFAEDTGKLKKRLFLNSVKECLNPELVSEFSRYVSDTIVTLFDRMDKGSKYPTEIFGFNGGFFREKIPSNVFFKDLRNESFFKEALQFSTLKNRINLDEYSENTVKLFRGMLNPIITNLLVMSSFDFRSEVNVNILGHIFEQSLNDLQGLQKEGTISNRKKEGIFYTPEYITEHICRTTIIPYLSNTGANNVEDLIEEYAGNISELEKKFEAIKILDPACGSGAFLIKAVELLLSLHKEIQNLKESKGSYTFTRKKASKEIKQYTLAKWHEEEMAKRIIERNIFGVDINEESVEITKLSLFLKIASNDRKLIDLTDNIKVGNSIIEVPILDNKALSWREQFKHIIGDGGFDIIIGNPPYVVLSPEMLQGYNLVKGNFNTYVAFIEKALKLVKPRGKISFIIPTTWLSGNNFKYLREELLLNRSIREIIQLPYDIFEAYIDTVIIVIDKQHSRPNEVKTFKYEIRDKAYEKSITSYQNIDSATWEKNNNLNIILDVSIDSIYEKYRKLDSEPLGSISKINRGTLPPKDDNLYNSKKNDNMISWFNGQIYRYTIQHKNQVYVDPTKLLEGKPMELFRSSKIMARQLVSRQFRLQFAFFDLDCAFKKNLYAIYKISENFDVYYLLAILNSKLFSFIHVKANVGVQRDDFPSFSLDDFRKFLIPKLTKEKQEPLAKEARNLMILNKELVNKTEKVKNRIKDNFEIIKLGVKLEEFYHFTFKDFLQQVNQRSGVKLSLKDQDEWEDYITQHTRDINELENQIKNIDRQIDGMVYNIYKLSESEIAAVEDFIKD
jgi:hypothetical protein